MQLIIGKNRMQEVEGVTAEYPYVLNRADSRRMQVPWHWHEEVEFSYILQGSLQVTISGRRYIFSEGEGFFLNTNILHAMEAVDPGEGALWDSHMIHPMLLSGTFKSVFDTKYMAPVLKNKMLELVEFRGDNSRQQEILNLLQQVSRLQQLPYSEFRTRNVFSEIWILLLQEAEDLERHSGLARPVSQERIQVMLEYIHQHYQEKLSLEQIAAAAIVSKRECLRCFQSCIGKTPVAYLLDYRIRMAERLLRTTALSVTEVAMETGFSNSAYFTKVFRELRSMTPSQYRNSTEKDFRQTSESAIITKTERER